MARVTVIRSDAQADYRIEHLSGCGAEAAVDYRIGDMNGQVIALGALSPAVGIPVGLALDKASREALRAVLKGVDPVSGEVIGQPVWRTHPDAQLPAGPLLAAVQAAAAEHGPAGDVVAVDGTGWASRRQAESWSRMVRGERREGMSHRVSVDRLEAAAAGYDIKLADVYGADAVEAARLASGERVDVRVRGFDLTFEVDKTVSIALALDPNRDQIEADLRALAQEFARDIERRYARAVVGHHGDGKARQEVAGRGLVMAATFDPVSREGDPHWHVHLTIANVTLDENGVWRALSRGADDLHHNAAAEGEAFKSMSRHMIAERYGWVFQQREIGRSGETAWRVAGVSEAQVRGGSTRQRRVEEYTRTRLGVAWEDCTDAQQDLARNATRPGKQSARHNDGLRDLTGFTRAALAAAGVPVEVDPRMPIAGTDPARSWEADVTAARDAIASHATDTQSTFRYSDARKIALGAVDGLPLQLHDTLVAAALDDGRIVALERYAEQLGRSPARWRGVYTTASVLNAERALQRLGRGTDPEHVLSERQVRAGLAEFGRRAGFELSAEQATVVRQVATADAPVVAIQGAAGTGKTTVMRALACAYEAAGMTVTGTSAAAVAKEVLIAKGGIDAKTIASLLGSTDPDKTWRYVGDVLIVDEASMADARDLARLGAECEARGRRMVCVGDTHQLPAIGATGGFATLLEQGRERGLTAELTEVRRQRHDHELDALSAWRNDRYNDAIQTLRQHHQVHVVESHSEAVQLAADLYRARTEQIEDPLARHQEATIVAARSADAAAVGELARLAARDTGRLHGPDHRYVSGGSWIDLAEGELVLLKQNRWVLDDAGEQSQVLNGRRAVIEEIRDNGDLQLRWQTEAGRAEHGVITARDVADGLLLPGYVERGQLLHGTGGTAHSTQGHDVEHAIVLGSGITTPELGYVALSRDKERSELVLAINDVAGTPEEANRLRAMPPAEREQAVSEAWVARIRQTGRVDQRSIHEQIEQGRTVDPAPAAIDSGIDTGIETGIETGVATPAAGVDTRISTGIETGIHTRISREM